MTTHTKKSAGRALVAVLASGFAAALHAAPTIDLVNQGYVTYGDANSYSIPAMGQQVLAGPGQIDLFVRLGSPTQLNNAQADMDDAFDLPSANIIEGFRTSGPQADPNGTGSWDRLGWWDSSLAAMNSAIDLLTHSMVFFFANNETGGQNANPNLAAWMRVEVTQISSGQLLGRYDLTNDFNQDGSSVYGGIPDFTGASNTGIVLGDPTLYTSSGAAPKVADFVQSGGDVCIDGAGLIVSCSGPYAERFQHNLGGDRAAYAVVMPELDALIAGLLATPNVDLGDFAIHVDFRLGCGPETNADGSSFPRTAQGQRTECDPNYAINGGAEKLFIGTQLRSDQQIPEPSTIALASLGLIAAAMIRRKTSAR